MDEVPQLLQLLRSADGLRGAELRQRLAALGPMLSLGSTTSSRPGSAGDVDASAAGRIAREGFVRLRAVAPTSVCDQLAEGIARLTTAGLPAMFIYLFDEAWHLGEAISARASAMMGLRYVIAEDVWAWRIAPGAGRGWPAHRGIATPVLARHTPELLNSWVALSDVEEDRACMHFVPLDADPSYPEALDALEAPPDAVRAAPLASGDALAWNANTLHWGGVCAAQARGARVSCSFSLVRAGTEVDLGVRLAGEAGTDLRIRLDAIARQIVTYGAGQPDVRPEVLTWAHGNVALARLSDRVPPP